MRDAVSSAANAAKTAGFTSSGYGADASTIGSNLVPFESRMLTTPSGYSQQDIGAMLTQGLAGAGGANSALVGSANKNAAATRNPIGFSAALDAAARSRDKAAAGVGEDIASKNAGVKLQQQNTAADVLSKLYGVDVNAQNQASGQIAPDINAEVNANKSGWLQNFEGILDTLSGAGTSAAGLKKAFG